MPVTKRMVASELTKFGNFDLNTKAVDLLHSRCNSKYSENTISKLFEGEILYFSNEDSKVIECDEKVANLKLVPVNVSTGAKKYYVAFYRNNTTWDGLRFDTREALLHAAEKKTSMRYCSNFFLEELEQLFLNKERWFVVQGGRRDYLRLKTYLSSLCALVKRFQAISETSCFALNESNTKILFDCNLLNKFGGKIILSHDIKSFENKKETIIRYLNPSVIGNSKDAEDQGFDPAVLSELQPFPLYTSSKELLFEGKLTDFELDDFHHLEHIQTHRDFRLPPFMREMSSVELFYLIKHSIEMALQQQSVDFRYIQPSYSINDLRPLFVIPIFKIGATHPSCCLLINKQKKKWVLLTVLELEQAYISSRIIAPPVGWLDI